MSGIIEKPWGYYVDIVRSETQVVKKVVINPGESLSLQWHRYRQELWLACQGVVTVELGLESHSLKTIFLADQHSPILDWQDVHNGGGLATIKISYRTIHRASNETKSPVTFWEIQEGEVCSEDDIHRIEDRYGRN